jgi:DNA-binding CsgD family transcriptional regulator
MPRLARRQDEARQRIMQLGQCGLAPEQFARALLAALEHAIPSDGQRLFGIDPGTLLVNRVLAASTNDGAARLEWLRTAYLASAPMVYIEFPYLMRAGVTVVACHDNQKACWGYPLQLLDRLSARDHYHAYHDTRTPVGGVLLASFAAAGRWIAALQMYRRTATPLFHPSDVEFLRLLAPAIGRALGAALAREQALVGTEMPAPDATGVLILAPDGVPRVVTPAGERWIDLLQDPGDRGDGALPTAVWSAMAGLSASIDNVAHAVVAPTRAGLVRVEASPGDEEGSIAVVLTPLRRPIHPGLPPGWPLTRQEQEVVTLFIGGLNSSQIATKLSVSQKTVQSHFRHIYEKLDVHSQAQLLARFFREFYLPALDPTLP